MWYARGTKPLENPLSASPNLGIKWLRVPDWYKMNRRATTMPPKSELTMNARNYVWIFTIVFLCVLCAGVVSIAAHPQQNPPQENTQAPPPPTDPQDPRFKISFFSHDLRVPISVGVLIDNSGSMRHKLQQALQTVREIATALGPQDEMFVISFNSDVDVRHHFTTNMQEIQRSFRDLKAGGETAAYDAIELAVNEEMKKAKHNKKVLLLVTDGFDTKSRINSTQVEDVLKRAQILVYAIGIDDDDDDPLVLRRTRYHIYHYMLGRLTSISGGRAFRLFTGRNYALNSLAQVLLEELHQQYTLSYYPGSGRDKNAWRQVEVKVKKAGSQIRHRTGYYVNQSNKASN